MSTRKVCQKWHWFWKRHTHSCKRNVLISRRFCLTFQQLLSKEKIWQKVHPTSTLVKICECRAGFVVFFFSEGTNTCAVVSGSSEKIRALRRKGCFFFIFFFSKQNIAFHYSLLAARRYQRKKICISAGGWTLSTFVDCACVLSRKSRFKINACSQKPIEISEGILSFSANWMNWYLMLLFLD